MDEIFRQTIIALRGMWRHRRLGMAVAWAAGITGLLAIAAIPDKYEAAARMFVNTESILKPLMAGMTVAPDIQRQIDILTRVLISRPNVEKLISMSGQDMPVRSKDDLEKQADELLKNLQIRGTGRDQIYTITLRDRDPELAKRMVERFTTLFIESGQGRRDVDTDVAKKFVDQQIENYEKKLQDAEGRLKEFKRRYLGMSPGEGKDYFARLAEANNLLVKAQLELREAEQSRDALGRGLANMDTSAPLPVGMPDPRADIEMRIESMKRDLSIMLQKYTEAHPDVIGLRRVIQDLEAQRDQLPRDRKNAIPASATGQLNVSLAQAEASVASLRARVAEYSARESKLKESAMLMPQLEAEFAQLNRDYEVNKKNYESLIQRRESVSLSGDMQTVSGVGDFKLIDPPRVSPRPVTPNRPLLFMLGLFLSLSVGVMSAYVASMLRPTFYDVRALREATKFSVLGSVMMSGNGAMLPETKKAIVRYMLCAGALVFVYAAGFVVTVVLTQRPV